MPGTVRGSETGISELLLHWIWQKRLYKSDSLRTVDGKSITILSPGNPAEGGGPDFVGAEIRIEGLRWKGDVEIDIKPQDWYNHNHHMQARYRSVILHVVWEAPADSLTVDTQGREIPILALSEAVNSTQLARWRPALKAFPCAQLARSAPENLWLELYDKWGEKRLLARHQHYRNKEELLQGFWEALAYSFGAPQGQLFEKIAHEVPWTTLQRYAETLLDKEALLLGIAGLLNKVPTPQEEYEENLLKRWHFLRSKLGWNPLMLDWAPSRPVASPWVRLAMLAALLDRYPQPIDLLESPPNTLPLPSPYWQVHWAWQRPFKVPIRRSPPLLMRNLRINALYPFGIFYLRLLGKIEKTLEIIEAFRKMPPESHRYARIYARWAYPARNAWQTQGQIQLWREACSKQICLQCTIGNFIRKL
ncbi:MAG: DUF2851 family protein [Bacteroidia bacterium]|nr:DUF2851 family protein [Bacteroidia bacterium]MDW8134671.1 DUF2851 family protein [Bacteroidia bacterium]